jgi:hypothetical protein
VNIGEDDLLRKKITDLNMVARKLIWCQKKLNWILLFQKMEK